MLYPLLLSLEEKAAASIRLAASSLAGQQDILELH